MKSPLIIFSLLSTLALSSQAQITTYAEYRLGEDGVVDRPRDGSGNDRHFVSGAQAGTFSTTDLSPATITSAVLRTDEELFTAFRADMSLLPTDNFAVGIYARISAEDAATVGHVFTLGQRDPSVLRIALEADGWSANYRTLDGIEPGIPIGDFVPLVTDTWVHLAVIRNGGAATFYVDGVAQGAAETLTTPIHGANGHLGVDSGGARRIQGQFDDLRVLSFTAGELDTDIIAALQGIDSDADGLLDTFEQRIIDADAADAITTLADVLPGDDFDGDMGTNLQEMDAATDPTDPAEGPVFDSDGDGMADDFELQIVDADPNDAITTIADVLPEDDFDGDLYTNLEESVGVGNNTVPSDPVAPTSPNPAALEVDLALLAFWDFNDFDAAATTTSDRVADYPGTLQNGATYTADMGGRTGSASDYGMDFGDFNSDPDQMRNVAVTDADFLAAINASTAEDRLTVSFWQKNNPTVDGLLVGSSSLQFSSASADRAFHTHTPWANGQIYFDHESNTINRERVNRGAGADAWIDSWNHIVLIKGRRTKQMWRNGVQIGVPLDPIDSGMAEMIRLSIGSGEAAGTATTGTQSVIDDFAIYNDVLTSEQIALLAGGASPFALVGGEPEFRITEFSRVGNTVSLTWDSEPTERFTVQFASDLGRPDGMGNFVGFENDVEDGILADAGDSTTFTIDLADPFFDLTGAPRLFFRILKEN